MNNYVSIIFCRHCKSRYVEIAEWSEKGNGIIWCRSCNSREEVKGFLLGRCTVTNTELQRARDTVPPRWDYEK